MSTKSCSVAVLQSKRGKRLEAEGKNIKCQMTKFKWRNLWESGKTSSECESKIFSPSLGNQGAPWTIFAAKQMLKCSKKDF